MQRFFRFVAILWLSAALPALAQGDPPARVGRLAIIENQVNFRVDRSDQASPAAINWPISSGAVLETGRRGRAEVWIGSTAFRLADDSQAEFTAVDDARIDLRLNAGTLAVSILDRDQVDDVVIATPDGDVRFQTPGRYRIDVFDDHTELSVQAGRAVIDDGRRAVPVAAGQKISRWNDGQEQLDGDWRNDRFDRWVAERENATLGSVSRQHVSPGMTGYADLDAYGDWATAPEYGAVWYPRAVADDWAPYRDGRWAWIAPWGWTWIDQAPWGFAPFHYGRWAIIHGRWGWIPGRLVARPVYAPALVGWVGDAGWQVSFSFGSAPAVGWYPLAPREVYVPAYRYSPTYVRQINISHVHDAQIINRAVRSGQHRPQDHRHMTQALTVVPRNLMREGRPISAAEAMPRRDRQVLDRLPERRHAPDEKWLAPAPQASRPLGTPHRFTEERQDRRNAPPASAPMRAEPVPMDRSVSRPEMNQRPLPMPSRDAERHPNERPAPMAPAVVDTPRRMPRMPDSGNVDQSEQPMRRFDGRREEARPNPAPRPAPEVRQPVAEAASPPARREFPAPERRVEEPQVRPAMPAPQIEREQRREMREMREMQRLERPAPRENMQPEFNRSREMPRPVPESRPQPEMRPAAPPREMAAPRMEPPRVERPRIEQPRIEAPRMEPQRAEPPRMEQRRAEPPRMEARQPAPQPAAPEGNGRQRHRDEERGGR